MSEACRHTLTQGREGHTGSWCLDCGEKVYEDEQRQCGGCAHHVRLLSGSICRRHGMAIVPGMLVTFKISAGSCWEAESNPRDPGAQS